MSEREYIVSLNKGVDYAGFNAEMVTNTGSGDIPNRSVNVEDARVLSLRNTHYSLTDEEAVAIKSDPRVYDVTLLPELDPNIGTGFDAVQAGNFTKTTLDRGDFLNWGMRRVNEATSPYTGATASTGGYNYTLDGTGVDVVIMDSGIQVDHPEFQDAAGVSRVQQIDWYAAAGVAGSMPGTFYTDTNGHGTHVAGTACGKTYGWAKNAKIYAMHVNLGSDTTGLGINVAFDLMLGWHNAKPVDATTGVKRPTIINMSWGYLLGYNTVSSMVYRGVAKTGTAIDSSAKRAAFGLYPAPGSTTTYRTNVRVSSTDLDVDALIDAGAHVCIAAGNRSHKIDVAAGLDYSNVVVSNGGTVFYNRGSSPSDVNAHIVGSIDSAVNASGIDQKAVYSETGPAVSVYAPGTDIMSAMSTTNAFSATTSNNPYPGNATFLINNISGTSMATPQVAGMLSLWLQLNPGATPAQALAFISSTAKTSQIYDTASTTDYTDRRSLLGSTNRYLFNKFNSSVQLRIGDAPEQAAAAGAATYSLATSAASVNEGTAFIITLTTTNVTDGYTIPYTITGVSSADISGASLTGNFTVSSNTATATFTMASDATTEGTETFLLSLDSVSASQSVTINDTSLSSTYGLAGSSSNVDEGSNLTITLTTANVADAVTVPYTITGVTSADIGGVSLTGNFTVASDTATLILAITADATTEGAETLVVTLDSGVATVSTTVNDTSQSGAVTYSLSSSAAAVDEGSTVTITLTTANVADSTVLPYTITGVSSADISGASLTGNFVVNSNTATLGPLTIAADTTTEGAETMVVALNSGAATQSVTINDTSTSASPGYSLASNSATVDEGGNFTLTLTTTNVANATNVPYTMSGIVSSDLDNDPRSNQAIKNFTGAGSGFFKREVTTNYLRIVAAGAVLGQTAVPDDWLKKTARMVDLFLDKDGSNIVENTQDQFISNIRGTTTSWHPNKQTIQRVARASGASYSTNFLTDAGATALGLDPLYNTTMANDMVWYLNAGSGRPQVGDDDAAEVIEHVFHTMHMYGLDANAMKFWPYLTSDWASGPTFLAMKEAEDASKWDPSGYAPLWKTNSTQFPLAVKEYLYLLNFSMFEYTSLWDGGSLGSEWSDDMRTPAGLQTNNPLGYALHNTYIAPVLSKPTLSTIRSIFQNGDNGDPTAAGASGYAADAAISLTGNLTVNSNTATLKLNVAPDVGTEGAETLAFALDNGQASQNVTINDSSTARAATYALSSSASSVNEGSSVTISLITTDVADATSVPYTITGVTSADIGGGSLTGNFTVSSNAASVTITMASDLTTEGAETMVLAADGTAATVSVTVGDTSVGADYTLNIGHAGSGAYTLSGTDRSGSISGNNTALAFNNGDVVDFVVSAGGHPFYVKTAQVTGTGSQASGVTNQGSQAATMRWTIGATGTYYYICQYHAAMYGTITVS